MTRALGYRPGIQGGRRANASTGDFAEPTLQSPFDSTEAWARLFRRVAEPVLAGTPLDLVSKGAVADAKPFIETFSDEHGHRRAVDRPLLALLLGVDPGPTPPVRSEDERLWWALHDRELARAAVADALGRTGPVTAEDSGIGVEIWTETELAALHALDAHARSQPDPEGAIARRVRSAARWHVERLQPDNATNHPWAAHVFARLSVEERDIEARMHAETLLNIASVSMGRPDRFSACILLDAARSLEPGG